MNEDDSEYEIFPHKLLEDLKDDVEALKKKLSEPETATQELIAEIGDLRNEIKELNSVFKEALQDIKGEDSAKLLASLQNNIEAVVTQNETLARGIVAVSDRLDGFMKKFSTLVSQKPMSIIQPNLTPSMAPPNLPLPTQMPSRMAPPPLGQMPSSSFDDVPLPPPNWQSKRKGIF